MAFDVTASPHVFYHARSTAMMALMLDWRMVLHTLTQHTPFLFRRTRAESSLLLGGSAFSLLRRDRRLDTSEKYFLACLVDLADDQGRVHLSLEKLNVETGLSTGKLSGAIKMLAALHYIRAFLSPNETGHAAWLIYVGDGAVAPPPPPGMKRSVLRQEVNGAKVTLIIEAED